MAYCDIDDVQALNPQRGDYSSSTKPTSTEVTTFITTVSDEIDSVLKARGVSVPVTAPAEFLSHLEQVNANGAAAYAEFAMFPEAAGTPGGSPQGDRLWKIYQGQLKSLREDQLPIDLAVTGAQPRSFWTEREATDTEPSRNYSWLEPKLPMNKEY